MITCMACLAGLSRRETLMTYQEPNGTTHGLVAWMLASGRPVALVKACNMSEDESPLRREVFDAKGVRL